MPAAGPSPASPTRHEENGPPCRRCAGRRWDIQVQPKTRLRYLVETVVAAPDVWIFQSESGGWPRKDFERWTCAGCGRSVRV